MLDMSVMLLSFPQMLGFSWWSKFLCYSLSCTVSSLIPYSSGTGNCLEEERKGCLVGFSFEVYRWLDFLVQVYLVPLETLSYFHGHIA